MKTCEIRDNDAKRHSIIDIETINLLLSIFKPNEMYRSLTGDINRSTKKHNLLHV